MVMSARDEKYNCIPMFATMATTKFVAKCSHLIQPIPMATTKFVANCSHLIQPIRVQKYMILSCDTSSNECALTV